MNLYEFTPAPTEDKPFRLFAKQVGIPNPQVIAFNRNVAGLSLTSGYCIGTEGTRTMPNGAVIRVLNVKPGAEYTWQGLLAMSGDQSLKNMVQSALAAASQLSAPMQQMQPQQQYQPQQQFQAQPQAQPQVQQQPQYQQQPAQQQAPAMPPNLGNIPF